MSITKIIDCENCSYSYFIPIHEIYYDLSICPNCCWENDINITYSFGNN